MDKPTSPIQGHPLLTTKLRMPHAPPHLVRRSRLEARLQQSLEQPLTLIAAPAGFGKTTLLAAWLQDAPASTAWVSLERTDDDSTRFWSYLLAALEAAHAGLGAHHLLAQSAHPPSMDGLLTTILNELAVSAEDVVLVLDDYQVITTPAIHAALTFFLEHLPAQVHLVISTRADPPLPLARLRARGQVVEIRTADLRFTVEEAAAFLGHMVGAELPETEIAALDDRTEGWIAGLQLAALSLHGRPDRGTFLQAFTGTHRFVVDYLTEEVVTRQPDAVHRFLLETAILERLCAPLCDAVMGETASQAMLEQVEAANLFLLPLDDERQWYRYHQLFADVLRQRLQRGHPERVALLHQRASAWYASHSFIHEAVHHALAAGDVEQAGHLIEQYADLVVKRGEVATLRSWLATLPESLVRERVNLCLWQSWLLALDGQYRAAEHALEELERPPGHTTPPASEGVATPGRGSAAGGIEASGRIVAIRSFIAFRRGDLPRTIELGAQALAHLPAEAATRGLVAWHTGIAHGLNGDLPGAVTILSEARAISQAVGDHYTACMITFELAQIQASQGQLHQAEQRYAQALALAAQQGGHLPATGPLSVGRGELKREWNDLDAATRDLEDGIARCRQTGNTVILLLGYVSLARVKQAQGDSVSAAGLLQTIAQTLQTHELAPHNAAQIRARHARVALQLGDLALAARWGQGQRQFVVATLEPAREVEYLTWARVQLAQHQPAAMLPLMARLLPLAEHQGRVGSVLEILILRALAHQACGDEGSALSQLERALALAAPEGYIRLFVDEGAPLALLLQRLRLPEDRDGLSRYRDHLLSLLRGGPDTTGAAGMRMPPVGEPLSERELAVLRLIVAGYSNQEIADRLVLAVSTVKWYINAIYGKLQVESRTKAIARARELHIS